MQGRILAVLMWKHLMVRKKRYIHTPLEILSPLGFFLLLFIFKDNIKAVPPSAARSSEVNQIRNTDVLKLTDLSAPWRVLYTPENNLTNALMDEVGKQLGLNRFTTIPDRINHQKGYYGFNNISEVADLIMDLHNNEAIVLFEDMKDRETWPDQPRLTYTVRMKDAFFTNTYETLDGVKKPHRNFGEIYHRFMRLQWAIDTSYIKVLTGNEIPQRLSLQELPSIGRSNDAMWPLLSTLLRVLCALSLLTPFVLLMSRLMDERSTGILELIKMFDVSSNLLGISHFLNVLPVGLVYCIGVTILLKVSSNPIVEHSNGLLILILLLLHFVSVMAMAFACSYLTTNTQYATIISTSVYMTVAWIPANYLALPDVGGARLLSGLVPTVPVNWFWEEISLKEQYGEGLGFGDITRSHSSGSGPVLLSYLCLVLQSGVFFALAWYLSVVRPGNHGQAQPWNFLFQKQYWTKNEVKPEALEPDEEEPMSTDKKYFEDPPKNMEVGIKIENVSKVFPKHRALNNVSLDVYKGEITVLLGHNGAGKTTLMSIITGMFSASSGKVLVGGLDTVRQARAARRQLGLCPQHNLFYHDLSLLQHVMFFTLLKGGSFTEAKQVSLGLLERLRLREKAHVGTGELSGGMQRRLQLACALAGDAAVLVLDEPTSGLDVETRRELWDLLLSLRGERTVLLTTHFMEEADALGDRVAALHAGRLTCHATPMFLKKAIGTGYRLTFTTNGPPREVAITDAVKSFVPQATLKEETMNSLSYNLPAAASGAFPLLFTTLEERKSELSIETIGVGVSTLEEVFLKLCSDSDVTYNEDEVDPDAPEPTFNKVTGSKLYIRQFCVLLKRQFKYFMNKKISFFTMQLFIPILMVCLFTLVTNNDPAPAARDARLALDLHVYSPLAERRVLCDVTAPGVSLRALSDRYPGVDFVMADNITDVVLRSSAKDATEYNKYLAGIEINDTDVKVLFTTVVRHAAPIALNLLSNALATRYVPRADGRTLVAALHPVTPSGGDSLFLPDELKLVEPKEMGSAFVWCIVIVITVLATNSSLVSLPCGERAAGTRHAHVTAGCPGALHWAATLCAHAAICAPLLAATAVAAAALDADSTFTQADFILSMLLVLSLGSLAFFGLMYLVSFYFTHRVANMVLVVIVIIFGLITTSFKTMSEMFKPAGRSLGDVALGGAAYSMPPHAMVVGVGRCVQAARHNAYCRLNAPRCPLLLVPEQGFDAAKCCAGEKPRCYMCIDDYAPWKELIALSAQFVVYMTLVLLTQHGTFKRAYERLVNARYRNSAQTDQRLDEIVRAEAVYVNKQIALPKKKIAESNIAMLVSDLHKNYHSTFGKSCNAVKGISFSVKQGECFGLLGVNGAGKSTTFKMLTGEEVPTSGRIYAAGHFSTDTRPYLRSLGYCPQFFGLDDFLTGRDNLALLLTLRGLDAEQVDREVKLWIGIVGLEKYSARAVAGYSGGCARRLAAGAALAVGAPLALLDEPTSGVDVAARRRVWAALARGLRRRRAVVITSHSMDEMEALSSRIAIMAGGVVRAIGTPSELRARHAAGHAVIIKVKSRTPRGDDVDSGKTEVDNLKQSVQYKFNCTLKDEHKTMLHYHINETMRYSRLFSLLEELRLAHPSLEDYSVTETTLEEVFLAFAKEQREADEATPKARRNHVV